jgi:hypothetical protein
VDVVDEEDRFEVAPAPAGCPEQDVGEETEEVVRSVGRGQGRRQQVREGSELDPGGAVGPDREQDPPGRVALAVQSLPDETRLADARLADDHEDLGLRVSQEFDDRCQLGVTSGERPTRLERNKQVLTLRHSSCTGDGTRIRPSGYLPGGGVRDDAGGAGEPSRAGRHRGAAEQSATHVGVRVDR